MPSQSTADTATRARTAVQKAALAVGIVFLGVGVLGFVPGITTNYDDLSLAGRESEAALFGIFQVSVVHNLVHLVFGAAGVAMARRVDTARTYLLAGGAVYLVLWLYGLLIDKDSGANVVPVNSGDDWLHFVLGVGMIALAFLTTRRTSLDRGLTGPR